MRARLLALLCLAQCAFAKGEVHAKQLLLHHRLWQRVHDPQLQVVEEVAGCVAVVANRAKSLNRANRRVSE